MKELSTEEKAKRYDEVIERARTEYKNHEAFKGFCEMLVNIFPELEESEDERIRKTLRKRIIRYDPNNEILIKEEGISQKQFLAWLEKQGEQIDIANKEYWRGYREGKKEILDKYAELEQQSEQNHDDKIEPKFKEGQWIVFNGLTLYINEVVKGYYRTISKGGIRNSYDWDIDNAARLWTLNEAKDGDVLVASDGSIFIYKYQRNNSVVHYIAVTSYNELVINENDYSWENKNACHPATKEQRDKLEKAMLKAGYKWNTEERKLEKI